MNKIILEVKPREVFGKKLRKLRIEGLIPANVYGPEFKSRSITISFNDFIKTYKVAKETGVVHLTLGKEEIPVLIKNLQRHPVTEKILHVDFRKIDLAKKVTTEVPVKVIGASEAVSVKGGVLLTLSETLEVEALPSDIPHEIEVDIAKITEIGQEIKVGDLPKSAKYEIKTPADKVIVSVVAHKEESITPETTAVAPEVITEAKPEEGAEVAPVAAVEGAKPEEVKKPAPAPTAKSSEKKEEKK